MSDLTINCPHCSQPVLGDTDYAGQTLSCPNCSGEFVMPGDPAPQQPAVVTPASGGSSTPTLTRRGNAPAKKKRPLPGASSRPPREEKKPAPHRGDADMSGLGKLFADPVTGQREACDALGPGSCFLFGILFLVGIPGLIDVLLITVGEMPLPGSVQGMLILSGVVYILIHAIFIWLFKIMSSREGDFREILFVTGFAFFWMFIFMIVLFILARQQVASAMSSGMMGEPSYLLIFLPIFAMSAFVTIIYGAFRDLCDTSGTTAFWFTPLTIILSILTFQGYIWALNKVMAG